MLHVLLSSKKTEIWKEVGMKYLLTTVAAVALPTLVSAQSFSGPSVGAQFAYGDAETTGPSLDGADGLAGLRAY